MTYSRILNLLIKKKQIIVSAEGGSMLPVLHPGDVLYLTKTNFSKVNEGEIIFAKKKGKFFIHRIIYKGKNYLITKGDANRVSDGKIAPGQIFAKLIKLKRQGRILSPEYYNLIQSTYYIREINRVIKAFKRHQLDYVFLKGLPLYLYLQKMIPLRFYADCDLLIARKDYRKAAFLLEKIGFKFNDRSFSGLHRLLKKKPTEYMFIKKKGVFPVVLDIHLEPVFLMNQLSGLDCLYPQLYLDKLSSDFLKKKQDAVINNSMFRLLSSSHQIIYLALHFFHHNFRGFHRLQLLRDSVQHYSGPWEKPAEMIKKYKLDNFVYPAFAAVKRFYPGTLTGKYLTAITPSAAVLDKTKAILKDIELSSEESQLKEGIERFMNIFLFSPQPNLKKISVFLNPQVLYSILFTVFEQLQHIDRLIFLKKKSAES